MTLGDKTLTSGIDYDVSYSGNVDVGTAVLSVVGKGNYAGTATGSFEILPADASGAEVEAADLVYSGEALEPEVKVVLGEKTLAPGTDYDMAFSDNVSAGTACVKVSFKGNYTGSAEGSFEIAPASISDAEVKVADQVYSGEAIEPEAKVLLEGRELAAGTDYDVAFSDNVDVGTAGVAVSFKGNYKGSAEASFEISPASISGAMISVDGQTYTGSPLEPEVRVELGGRALSRGVDYSVSYSDNIGAGTATVTVTGKGNYTGTATGSFEILPADASGAVVEAADQVYSGEALEPEVGVVLGEKTLAPGIDYDVAFSDNVNTGAACVEVSFKGNYTGSAEGSFEIAPASISGAVVDVADQVYSGEALEPEVSVTLGGKTLERHVDYDVAFSDNVDAGTATVTVTGIGNYAGSAEGSFAIARADISGASLSTVSEATYTGSALEPEVRVELGGRALSRGTDYFVTYRDNVGVGTATATVTGVGNYAGSASVTFAIVAAPDPDPEPTPTPDPEPTPAPDPEPEPVAWTFKDVSSSVAHSDDINWLASVGVSTGWAESDGTRTFRPYWDVARADMAAFLYRLAGSPEYTAPSTSPFKDVDSSTAHYKEICWLAEEGISQGWSVSGGKEFRPYATVARCDMAAFLYRLAGSPDYTVSGRPFIDCNSKTPHYKEVCWLASTGVSAGWDVSGGKEFRSYNKVARADMAAFLHRMKDKDLV